MMTNKNLPLLGPAFESYDDESFFKFAKNIKKHIEPKQKKTRKTTNANSSRPITGTEETTEI